MSKARFPWVLGGILLLSFAVFHVAGLVLAVAGAAGAYVVSLRLHPRTRHWRCGGTGESRGAVFTWVHRRCGGCSSGRVVRWGARQWGSGPVRAEGARVRRARAAARQGHSWR